MLKIVARENQKRYGMQVKLMQDVESWLFSSGFLMYVKN